MPEELTGSDEEEKEVKIDITYYFTVIFIVIGTWLTLYVLNQTMENLGPFMVLLSIWGGGLPFGFIGAFIDYQVSKYKWN